MVVPVLNAENTLPAQLSALTAQCYDGEWEIVVADNGSTDASRSVARRCLADHPRARVIDTAGRRAPSRARNAGARAASGDFLVFCDADDVVRAGWLAGMADAARSGAIVAGALATKAASPGRSRPMVAHKFLPFASGSNLGIWTRDFWRLGGFDESFMAGEDIDLSWRAQLAGLELAFGADAVVDRRARAGAWGTARQHYRYGQGNARLYRRHRSAGMCRPAAGKVAADWRFILGGAVPRPSAPRDEWARRTGLRVGQLVGSVRNAVLFP